MKHLIFFLFLIGLSYVVEGQTNAEKPNRKYIDFCKRPYMQMLESENIFADSSMKFFMAFKGNDQYQFLSIGHDFMKGKFEVVNCNNSQLDLMLHSDSDSMKMLIKVVNGKLSFQVPEQRLENIEVSYIPVEDFHYHLRLNHRSFLTLVEVKYDNRGNALNSEIPDIKNDFMIGQQDVPTLRKIAQESEREH